MPQGDELIAMSTRQSNSFENLQHVSCALPSSIVVVRVLKLLFSRFLCMQAFKDSEPLTPLFLVEVSNGMERLHAMQVPNMQWMTYRPTSSTQTERSRRVL